MADERRTGRPSKLTAELQAKIVKHLEDGLFIQNAAALCGIHVDSIMTWRKRGDDAAKAMAKGEQVKASDRRFVDFAEAVARARAKAEQAAMIEIQVAARKDWNAARWYLERSYPDRYGAAPGRIEVGATVPGAGGDSKAIVFKVTITDAPEGPEQPIDGAPAGEGDG